MAALDQLLTHQAATGTTAYTPTIEALRRIACPGQSCGRVDRSLDGNAGVVALSLMRSIKADVQAVGLAVACGVCREAGKECRCDGRECGVSDVLPQKFHAEMSLVCGFVQVDGALYSWGHVVRERL